MFLTQSEGIDSLHKPQETSHSCERDVIARRSSVQANEHHSPGEKLLWSEHTVLWLNGMIQE